MQQGKIIKQFYLDNPIGIYLLIFLIPIYPKLFALGILILLIDLSVRRFIFKEKRSRSKLSFREGNFWLIIFFLLHIIGVSYSENISFAWMDIGMKLSFIVFPIIFILNPIKINWEKLASYFILGALVSVLICFIMASINYYNTGYYAHYFDSRLSFMMHRSYWATYLVMASLFSWFLHYRNNINLLKLLFLFIIFSAFIFMSGSKMGIILLLISTLIWIFIIMLNRKAYAFGVFTALFLVVIGFSVDYFAPQLSSRIHNSINSITTTNKIDPKTTESNASRILVWRSSKKIISNNFFFGVGTGDIKDELKKQNLESGYTGVANLNMNAHNQFLNTHVALGVFGSLSLLFAFITAFYNGIRKRIIVLPLVVLILFLSLLTESFFETQAVIVPGAFILSLIANYSTTSAVKD